MVLLAALCATPAHALTVTVEAPDELKTLLMQYLETARAARLGEQFDADEIARLQRQSELTARDLLATEGYFSPQVESAVERVGDDWRVNYRVRPGARTIVRSVKLEFDGALKTQPGAANLQGRIERSFSLKQGMPFRQADWDAAKRAVLSPLLRGRYPAAWIVASEARVDPATHSADLTLTVDSGPAFNYGEPAISGAQRYPESIVRHLSPLNGAGFAPETGCSSGGGAEDRGGGTGLAAQCQGLRKQRGRATQGGGHRGPGNARLNPDRQAYPQARADRSHGVVAVPG